MGELLNLELEQKAIAVRERLAAAVEQYGRVVYSSSLGAESVVLTDIIWSHFPAIDIFTIDTGRLPEETYELIGKVQARYRRNLRVVYPDAKALESLVSAQGVNAFYNSLEARTACCQIRKVEPFKRAIAGYGAWVTGVRHEQSATRAQALPVEWEHGAGAKVASAESIYSAMRTSTEAALKRKKDLQPKL